MQEIKNNTVFNDNPSRELSFPRGFCFHPCFTGQFMDMSGITLIPPEAQGSRMKQRFNGFAQEELRNLLDAAGETIGEATEQARKGRADRLL